MNVSGYDLHALRFDLARNWAVTVNGNWRLIFRFDGEHAVDVDLRDYH